MLLTDLPEELLQYIIYFLSSDDVIRLRLVSKLFYRLAGDEVIWRQRFRDQGVQVLRDRTEIPCRSTSPTIFKDNDLKFLIKDNTVPSSAHLYCALFGPAKDSSNQSPVPSPRSCFLPWLTSSLYSPPKRQRPKYTLLGPGIERLGTKKLVTNLIKNHFDTSFDIVELCNDVPSSTVIGTTIHGVPLSTSAGPITIVVMYSNCQPVRENLNPRERF